MPAREPWKLEIKLEKVRRTRRTTYIQDRLIYDENGPPTPATVEITLSPTGSEASHHFEQNGPSTPATVKVSLSPTVFGKSSPFDENGPPTALIVQASLSPTVLVRMAQANMAKRRKITATATPSPATRKSARSTNPPPNFTVQSVNVVTTESISKKTATASKKTSAPTKVPELKRVTAPKKPAAPKKAPPKSTAPATKKTASKAATTTKANTSRKRKVSESEDEEEDAPKPPPRATKRARAPKAPQPPKQKVIINHAPLEKLNVYVFGEGSAGELGLGTAKTAIDVKRPRLNPFLTANDVGVVMLACGGMHAIALTHDSEILTWGVNDDGALGRDTSWSGGLRAMDKEESDSDDEDSGLNPKESTPTAVPSSFFPEGTVFTHIAASDSASFAVTDEGLVYGWGTFRNSEGILGFSPDAKVQRTPILLEHLGKIKTVACGSNSAFAIDINGHAFCWGANAQSQLGYRSIERHQPDTIIPTPLRMGRKKIRYIACGNDHTFAIDDKDQVWAWGLNGHGQTGTHIQREGSGANVVHVPTKVPNLTRPHDKVIEIAGGGFHTVAVTENGACLTFGRCDNNQMGIDPATLTEDQVGYNDSGKRAAQLVPLPIPTVTGVKFAAAGTDHSIVISGNDEPYSWGFSANYQTGQGRQDDILIPTKIENTAIRGKTITWAGCGGQYSIIAGPAEV